MSRSSRMRRSSFLGARSRIDSKMRRDSSSSCWAPPCRMPERPSADPEEPLSDGAAPAAPAAAAPVAPAGVSVMRFSFINCAKAMTCRAFMARSALAVFICRATSLTIESRLSDSIDVTSMKRITIVGMSQPSARANGR
eukprot:Amastigsp_a511425_24.p4 type:complete len:139 gc:universal Amastigsp_a511425_24:368-784(+)